jgi:hypothetical protein
MVCCILPAAEFVEIGRANRGSRMRAARAVLGRDVRAFDVESVSEAGEVP